MSERRQEEVAQRYAQAVRLFEAARAANTTPAAALAARTLAGAAHALAGAIVAARDASGARAADAAAAWTELCRARRRFDVLRTLCPRDGGGCGDPVTGTDDARILIDRFQELLVYSRRHLNASLRPGVGATLVRRPRARTAAITAAVVAAAVLPGASALVAYRLADPMRPATTGGQVFWAGNAREGFAQARSARFEVRADGRSHVYRLGLPQLRRVELFRIDPANDANVTQATLERVSLRGVDGAALWTWTPASAGTWHCRNCVVATRTPEAVVIALGRRDPYLFTATDGDPPGTVSAVEITMSVRSRRVPFWRWLLGIER